MGDRSKEIARGRNLKTLLTVKDIQEAPLDIKFDVTTLDMVIAFLYKPSVLQTRKTLSNMYKLFENLDPNDYGTNPEVDCRIWIIQQTLEAVLYDGFSIQNVSMKLKDEIECDEFTERIIDNIQDLKISHEESKHLVRKLDDMLASGYVMMLGKTFNSVLTRLSDGDFKTYRSYSDELYGMATAIVNMRRATSTLDSDQTFSLQEDLFEEVLDESLRKLKDRNRIFSTGIQRWNSILSPGYLSKRLYTYLAFPGKGKSQILLTSALHIKKYNQGVVTKDPDKRPAILFLTLENDIPETIERLYNMAVDSDDIRNYTTKQLINKMRKNGQLNLNGDNNIDIIIKEYKNRELDTNDLYTILQDLGDDGVEVVTLVLDYLKRIRPAEPSDSEKGELKNITNELKEVAKYFDIPVITAQQLNRTGASVVDAAMQANKDDVTKLVGRDAIAGAWEIIENSDFVCIINPETQTTTGKSFLTFKMLKRRYRSVETDEKLRKLEYFNHPYTKGNEIKLVEDVNAEESVSLFSLASDVAEPDNRGRKSAGGKLEKKESKKSFMPDFEEFDIDKCMNL